VSPYYAKLKKYETVFDTSEPFFASINKNKSTCYKNTILVLDDLQDDIKYFGLIQKISEGNIFYNVIVTTSKIMSMFYHIDTDITFCLHDAEPNYVYNRYIDKKIVSLNVFTDMFLKSTYDKNASMLNKNKVIKKCIYEKTKYIR